MRPDEVPKGESRRHRYWEDNKEASLAGAKFLGVQEREKGLEKQATDALLRSSNVTLQAMGDLGWFLNGTGSDEESSCSTEGTGGTHRNALPLEDSQPPGPTISLGF